MERGKTLPPRGVEDYYYTISPSSDCYVADNTTPLPLPHCRPCVAVAATNFHRRVAPPSSVGATLISVVSLLLLTTTPSVSMYAHPTLQTKRPPVRPPNGMLSAETAHPSQGGRPWPIEVRNMVVSMHLNGDDFHEASLAWLRAQYEFPSMRTVFCWLHRFIVG